ncbi:hypothetical protein [Streptomyces mayteni]
MTATEVPGTESTIANTWLISVIRPVKSVRSRGRTRGGTAAIATSADVGRCSAPPALGAAVTPRVGGSAGGASSGALSSTR